MKRLFLRNFCLDTTILLVLILNTSVSLNSQTISTVGEIYDYDVGDIFHYDFLANSPQYGGSAKKNVEILSKYYSQNNDTMFYIRDIDYFEMSSVYPNGIFKYYIDTVFYTDIDSLIRNGWIDSVYSDTSLYHGRSINYVMYKNYNDTWWLKYVDGCGLAFEEMSDGSNTSFYNKLIYYKKGFETWGTPIYVSVEDKKFDQIEISVYPNPADNYINVKSTNLDDASIEIFTMTGKQIKQIELKSETSRINISDICPGIYIIKIWNNKYSINKKLMIE